jgi:RND family efflux transporter MFP subunit
VLDNTEATAEDLGGLFDKILAVRACEGDPKAFWPTLLDAMASAAGASAACLLLRDPSAEWRRIAQWPEGTSPAPEAAAFAKALPGLCAATLTGRTATAPVLSAHAGARDATACALRLDTGRQEDACVAAFLFPAVQEEAAVERLLRLLPLAGAPAAFQERQLLRQSRSDVDRFASVLDLLVAMNQPRKFLAVAMVFCNELASRHKCERVSLGWLEREQYVRLQAISHTENFEHKMEIVKAMEFAMEEALDQDDEIVWPAPAGSTLITRDHEAFAKSEGSGFICSLPVRADDKGVGVVMLERRQGAFAEQEIRLLRLACDLAARRLSDLKRHDGWFGRRWAVSAREGLAKLAGVEHTWAKVLGAAACLGLGILFFGRAPHRVESPFILKPEQIVHVPAPFDGYIEEVKVRVGDAIHGGDALMRLDTQDLLLEEAAALADRERYVREAEKARAGSALAEMRIASALADEAKARLDLVCYRVEQATLKAPFDGVVAEGDLQERVGSPVAKGDPLFRVARLDKMYVQCEVSEDDIHDVRPGADGQIAFASEPRLKFPVRVLRIDPVAQPKEGKNAFSVRCELAGPVEDWWRPGMSGVAKLNAGRRNIFWILTHKTADFLRMKLWW